MSGNATYRDLGERSLLSAKRKVYPSAMEPVPLKRVLFWTAYAFGTLAFIFGLLLTQVPRGIHDKDFRLEVVIWGSCFCFLLICLLLLRRIFSARFREGDGPASGAYTLFGLLVGGELFFCLYALISIVIEAVSH